MREGAVFAAMFGLGAGAVLVGVTVSRLVVGQPPERSAEEPAPVAAEDPRPPVAEPPAIAEALPPAVAEVPRPAVVEPRPPSVGHARIAIVRGGAARPLAASRAPGPRIIHVNPHDGGR